MANTQYLGTNAGFNYNPNSSDTASTAFTNTFKLAVPLRDVQPSFRIRRYISESLDFTARQVFSVSTGVYEIVATLRMNNDEQGLVDFLRYGARGSVLVYSTANTTGSTAGTSVYLIEPSGDVLDTLMDRQRGSGSFEDLELTCRFRRTDGGSFSTML